MNEVREKKIKNTEIRKKFGNLQDIDYYVKKRAWTYIGKIVRQQQDSLQETTRSVAAVPKKAARAPTEV